MDWGKIKAIFIIAFLVLDVFLLTQLQVKREQYEVSTNTTATLAENLKADGVEYDELSEETVMDHYLSANTKTFTKEMFKDLKDQEIQLNDGTAIHSQLAKPFLLESFEDPEALNEFVQENVVNGEQYAFWGYDEEDDSIIYFQEAEEDKFIFMNQSAQLTFHLNDDGAVVSYDQTMLDPIEPINDEEDEVLAPIRAIEALYHRGALTDSKIVGKVKLGYYTLVNMEATQVLTPTWHVIVEKDGERMDMLVNAYEGNVIQGKPDKEKTLLE
ncbi:two-component system regulatory protein YycI [Bacillus sp. SD088]|uniref:two-component system regulatory protein YycI n=1 Tax=Bacillus sp. SD088 TaxID=2782012 RepID=UPI001A96CB30|nr:two-component system regulatory protein YycI [Bacillus sp. SD088]MBO0994871.1 two-component system regulatory protein YycI [Bacillus sp. SD088]